MKVLIVGGGIAGLTLAALLRQRGLRPTIVEKAVSYGSDGYVLGLWPLGSCVLHGLGLYEKFAAVSQPMLEYQVCNGHGEVLHRYDFHEFDERYGTNRSLMRSELLKVLRQGLHGLRIRMGTTIAALEQDEHEVRVRFSDGSEETFDMVAGCDGIHSSVRELIYGKLPLYRTGWAGYAFEVEPGVVEQEGVSEIWGAGRFFGMYPTKSRLCVFNGFPIADGHREPREGRLARLRETFAMLGGPVRKILDSLPDDREIFYTEYADIRVQPWQHGRVVLVGDAGSTLLPTAGVGASMAMESAAALADELSRADAKTVPHALELFEQRRRERVDHVQAESRKLARLMLVESTPLAFGRDFLMRFYSQEQFVRNFLQVYDQAI